MNRIPAGHEIINSAELASLRRKAKAHDAYLWATKRMADKAREIADWPPFTAEGDITFADGTVRTGPYRSGHYEGYRAGYADSLLAFAKLVVEAPSD